MNNNEALIKYINNYLSKSNIDLIFKSNNIITEKKILFHDFIVSLIVLMDKTYLGDDVTPYDERINHFNWCWSKVVSDFEKEEIYFNLNSSIYKYFKDFMIDVFYNNNINSKDNFIQILKIWVNVFTHNGNKTVSDIDIFLDIYRMFDESLKNK